MRMILPAIALLLAVAHSAAQAQRSPQPRKVDLGGGCYLSTDNFWDDTRKRWSWETRKYCKGPNDYFPRRMPMEGDPNDRVGLTPGRWTGKRPTEAIGGITFFRRGKVNASQLVAFGNAFDPAKRALPSVSWGTVHRLAPPVTTMKSLSGARAEATYVIPFCFGGDCVDPDARADDVLIVHSFPNGPDDHMYQVWGVFSRPGGRRYCALSIVEYNAPTCYNDSGPRFSVSAGELATVARAIPIRYAAISQAYEGAHAAEVGSPDWFAKHSLCRPATIGTYEGGHLVETRTEWRCELVK